MSVGHEQEFVVVGRVGRPHGVHGEVGVEVVSDVPDRFEVGTTMSAHCLSEDRRAVEIASVRAHRGQLLVRFAGVESREEAATLRGASLEVEKERVPPPPPGSYYYYQLVGCTCRDGRSGVIGRVAELIEDGGGLLLSVEDRGRTLLIPFVADYIEKIDIERREIELDVPPGLLELCVSRS